MSRSFCQQLGRRTVRSGRAGAEEIPPGAQGAEAETNLAPVERDEPLGPRELREMAFNNSSVKSDEVIADHRSMRAHGWVSLDALSGSRLTTKIIEFLASLQVRND